MSLLVAWKRSIVVPISLILQRIQKHDPLLSQARRAIKKNSFFLEYTVIPDYTNGCNVANRTIFYNGNLEVLGGLNSDRIDLIDLAPL